MQYYVKNEQMPWREILKILHWHLEIKMMDYRWVYEDIQQGVLDHKAGASALASLQESYRVYHAMRQFLGYRVATKLERQALELLEYGGTGREEKEDDSGVHL